MKSTFFYIDLGNLTLNPTTLSRVTYYISINKMVFRFIARGGKHWVWIGSLMSLVYNYYLLIYNPCSQHSCSTQAIYLGWDLTHRLTHLYLFFLISNDSLNKNHPCTQSVYSRYQLHGELTEVDQLIQGNEMGNV